MHTERPTWGRAGLGALISAFSAVVALACIGPFAPAQEQASTPQFDAISEDQLKSAMWQLAAGVRELETVLGREKRVGPQTQPSVIRILDQMIAAAAELGPGGLSTAHLEIAENLGRFREKLDIARDSALMNPPRYYLAGNFSGACLACHESH
jgi:hypothetical protein